MQRCNRILQPQPMFLKCIDYVFRISIVLKKENRFTLVKKTRSRRYPAETMTDEDYAADLALLSNTPAEAESLLHSHEQAAGDITLYANKTEFLCFKQEEAISTLSDRPLKFIDNFTYLGCYISLTECGISIHQVKAWNAIGSLLIIWKSNLSDEIKRDFFQAVAVSVLLCG